MHNTFILIALTIGLNSLQTLGSQREHQFKFRSDHTFKIVQFTDIHWNNNSPKCVQTTETINLVLATEKPDLAILTGDIVTDLPEKEGWLAVAEIFTKAQMPFAVVLGNHDSERIILREYIFELLQANPWFVGEKGPKLSGYGNYTIPLQSTDSKSIASVLYCLDSNDYPKEKRLQGYSWIKHDQIGWYRKTSDNYTANNHNMPVPSLMFFHIPLIEFNSIVGKESTIGSKGEGVASSEINSGLFGSLVEKRDVMGVFVGHDHNNNFIGVDHDICLGYGQATGSSAYGNLERGARIIELHEKEFTFDSWICTKSGTSDKFTFPIGLNRDQTPATFLPAMKVIDPKPGVRYNYFEGHFKSTDELASAKALKSGLSKNLFIDRGLLRDSFALELTTWIKIPKREVYTFYTYSDDGSKIFIDGQEIVNNPATHKIKRAEGKIALEEGYHELKLLHIQGDATNELEVGFASKFIRECKIPDWVLFH